MEAVAPHALVVKLTRQREDVIDEWMGAVESGVEAGDLPHMRPRLARRENAGDIVRLVQRRERYQASRVSQHLVGHEHGRIVMNAAMHDAMAGGDDIGIGEGGSRHASTRRSASVWNEVPAASDQVVLMDQLAVALVRP